MPLRSIVSLIVFSFACGVGANVWGTSVCLAQEERPARKPTPTPTPPPGGPNPRDPAGPSRIGSVMTDTYIAPSPTPIPRPRAIAASPSAEVGSPASVPGPVDEDTGGATRFKKALRKLSPSYRSERHARDLYSDICDPTEQEQEDLTGTYSGHIEFPSRKLSGPATLDIKGQRFTLSINGVDLSGDVSSVTTCDYTAVAMRFETPASRENSVKAAESISLKAQLIGSTLILTSVEGQTKFKFAPVLKPTSSRRR